MTRRLAPLACLLAGPLVALQPLAACAAPPVLAVCADPANLPYSNRREQGFENRIAGLLAADLHLELRYSWFPEHKNFIRRTLGEHVCDVVISVPAGLPGLATTRPYFRSSYVAVTRAADARRFASFDDGWLSAARIGVQLVGNEGATTPPVVALSSRGITERITAFAMWSGDEDATPQGEIIDAVADGRIDVAFVWGPFAGFFARAHPAALRVEPIPGDPLNPDTAFAFALALAVRKTDGPLRDALQAALDRHADEIAAVLRDAGIPTLALAETP